MLFYKNLFELMFNLKDCSGTRRNVFIIYGINVFIICLN
jgi:hypothetical protein